MIIWKTITNHNNYEVSNTGLIRNKDTGDILRPGYTAGYAHVTLNGKTVRVHRVVAKMFLPRYYHETPTKRLEVNHIDGKKWNNNVNNLEWVTRSENILHAYRTGLKKSTLPSNKIKIVETGEIFDSTYSCAKEKNLNNTCICKCLRGEQERHKGYTFVYLDSKLISKKYKQRRHDAEECQQFIQHVISLHNKGYSNTRIGLLLGRNESTIRCILKRIHKEVRDP